MQNENKRNQTKEVKDANEEVKGVKKTNAAKVRRFFKSGLWYGLERIKVRRNIKDRVFRLLFEKDREALLELYNALNGTDYHDASALRIVTLEGAVYMVMKNDLAFIVAGTLNLYEHQSTLNPNMPVRFLIYLAGEYQKLVEEAKESLYGTKLITLPTPQCVVFYNGEKEIPEEQTLRLSDAFEKRKGDAGVELTVRMLNINFGHNKELMVKCRTLSEYAEFVDICRQFIAKGGSRQAAINAAIDYCIEHDILSEFLRNNRAEVVGMLLEKFDIKKYENSLREEGREQGIEQGIERGIEKGIDRANQLTIILLEQNRTDDLQTALKNPEYQEQLFREFKL